jgi:broad specificity phosphatase PhoE
VQEKYPELFSQWVESPHLVKIPGGENLDDVRKRALDFVANTVQNTGTIVLVSHRVVHKILILALLGLDNSHFWNVKMDTAAITTFAYDSNRWVLTEHNNTSYLQPLKQQKLKDF